MRDFSRQYLKILKTEFSNINLTRILEEDEFYQKQIVDSLLPLENLKGFKEEVVRTGLLVDVGFGGGFPILPLAKYLPEVHFLGFEARSKKVEAVSKIACQLDLPNVHLIHKRVEEILFDRECVITFKAVGKVKNYLAKIKTNVPLIVIFYKGANFDELEGTDELPTGWELKQKVWVDLPGTEGRLFLAYCLKNVPYGTKSTKKTLANLTKFIEQFSI